MTSQVLIVDDNASLAHLSAYALKSAIDGLIVLTAGSCQEALVLANENRPSVFVVDLRLPDGDGLGLIEELKRRFPDVAAILTTASSLRRDFDGGLFGLLIKPYDPDDLINLVRQSLGSGDATCRQSIGERAFKEPEFFSGQYDCHYVQNRLSGLLAGIRALRLELLAVVDNPAELRATIDEYTDRLVAMTKDAAEAVKRGARRR